MPLVSELSQARSLPRIAMICDSKERRYYFIISVENLIAALFFFLHPLARF
jgi:hypothetical protein